MLYNNPEMQKEVYKMLEENYKKLKKGEIPKTFGGFSLERFFGIQDPITGEITDWRSIYCKEFGFPLISEDWIKPLAKWIGDRPCLEIMAGTGYLSYALKKYGVNIKATDNYSWNHYFKNSISVEQMDCFDAIKKYGKQVDFIVCSWPYMDATASICLELMAKVNPKCRMIYIGEDIGGCTANTRFFEIAEFQDIKGFNEAVSNYTRWAGIYDYIGLVKLNKENKEK